MSRRGEAPSATLGGGSSAMWFLVDKSVAGGLDDWDVKIADFVVLLGKDVKRLWVRMAVR